MNNFRNLRRVLHKQAAAMPPINILDKMDKADREYTIKRLNDLSSLVEPATVDKMKNVGKDLYQDAIDNGVPMAKTNEEISNSLAAMPVFKHLPSDLKDSITSRINPNNPPTVDDIKDIRSAAVDKLGFLGRYLAKKRLNAMDDISKEITQIVNNDKLGGVAKDDAIIELLRSNKKALNKDIRSVTKLVSEIRNNGGSLKDALRNNIGSYATGAGIGAAAGAGIGALVDKKRRLRGALIGGGVGLGAGALANYLARKSIYGDYIKA